MSVGRSASVVFLSKAASSVTVFVGFALFGRLLGGDAFGQFVLFLAVVHTLSIFTDLGINGAIEKRISERNEVDVLATGLAVKVGLTAVLSALLVVNATRVNAYIGGEYAFDIVLVIATRQLAQSFLKAMMGELRVAEAQVAMLGQRLTYVAFGLAAVMSTQVSAVVGVGVDALVTAYWAGWLLVLGWASIRSDTPLGRVRRGALASLARYAKFNFFPSVLSSQLYSWIDVVVLGFFVPSAAVAAYEFAWRLAGVVMLLSRSVGTALFPQVSNWHSRGEIENVEQLVPTTIFVALLLTIPALGGTAVLAPELLGVVFGTEFTVATVALVVLVAGKLPESVNTVVGRLLLGMNRPRYGAIASIAFISTNVGLNVVLIPLGAAVSPQYGLVGAAVATTVSLTVMLGASWSFLDGMLDLKVPWLPIGYCLLGTTVMTLTLSQLSIVVPVNGAVELLALVLVGVVIYAVMIYPFAAVRREIRDGIVASGLGRG